MDFPYRSNELSTGEQITDFSLSLIKATHGNEIKQQNQNMIALKIIFLTCI